MRYLVTGGGGFIGSHLVEHLASQGHEVVVLDNFSTGRWANLQAVAGSVRVLEGSITVPADCGAAMDGVDFVLHQAAIPSVPRSIARPEETHQANATGTLNVLVAARDAGVRRVVYASSSSVYGDSAELPKHEGMVPQPRSPYAVSKLAGEHYCRAFFHSYGVQTVMLRYFNIFGPRQDPESQYAGVIPRFVTAALREEEPVIYGDGEQTRDFTYVANVVRANLAACEAPVEACGEAYNVGCGSRITLNELWATIGEIVGTPRRPRYAEARAGDVRDSLASLTRTGDRLGYRPTVGLAEGLRRTIAALAEEAGHSLQL